MYSLILATLLIAADPGADVLVVLTAKCAACHGPAVKRPKGDPPFGYVLDLARLAADADKVVPGDPDASSLWTLVSAGNMPPNSAATGPMTAGQRETIRAWIAAGAPVAVPPPAVSGPVAGESQGVARDSVGSESTIPGPPTEASVTAWHRTTVWVGKWHLLALHFPIVLIVVAAAYELGAVYRRTWWVDSEVRCALAGAAVAAVGVAALGWLHAAGGAGAGEPSLAYHRWAGTAAAVLACVTAFLSEQDIGWGRRRILTRTMIFTTAGLVGLAAHLGGYTVHGTDYMNW